MPIAAGISTSMRFCVFNEEVVILPEVLVYETTVDYNFSCIISKLLATSFTAKVSTPSMHKMVSRNSYAFSLVTALSSLND
jgi:hypothetical protein